MAHYTNDEIALAEQLDILIKACWRAYSAKRVMPPLIWTCIKTYTVEAPYLVAIYGDLFVSSGSEFLTASDLQQYVLGNLR